MPSTIAESYTSNTTNTIVNNNSNNNNFFNTVSNNNNNNKPIVQSMNTTNNTTTTQLERHSVIVFDWDDTLLSSTFLSARQLRLDSDPLRVAEYSQPLRELESAVIAVITQALTCGEVHIITNAETGWVQLSAQKFIPAVLPILQRVSILSARSTYETRYPDSPLKWKFYGFQEKLANLFTETKKLKNILSFGDSHVEREAVRAVTRGFPNTRCKSVKFAERPTIEQLRRQLELVTNCFHYIHNHDGDLDLQLTVTINNSNNNSQQQKQPQPLQQQQPPHSILEEQNNKRFISKPLSLMNPLLAGNNVVDKFSAQNALLNNPIVNTTEEKPNSI
jgi:hypothetical protein